MTLDRGSRRRYQIVRRTNQLILIHNLVRTRNKTHMCSVTKKGTFASTEWEFPRNFRRVNIETKPIYLRYSDFSTCSIITKVWWCS